MLSKLPKPDTRATYLIAAGSGLPAISFVLEAEVKGSDIKWNNLLGKITMTGPGGHIIGSCHIGQFTGNCGAKYIAHLNASAPTVEGQKAVLKLIESFAYHKTN